jgi:hypothetical protein
MRSPATEAFRDILRLLVDAARLTDLRLLLDDGAVPGRQPDDAAEEALVDLAQNVSGECRELVRRVWVVEIAQDVFQDTVIDLERGGQAVWLAGAAGFVVKVKEP